jgi:hypothetical protein
VGWRQFVKKHNATNCEERKYSGVSCDMMDNHAAELAVALSALVERTTSRELR